MIWTAGGGWVDAIYNHVVLIEIKYSIVMQIFNTV